jgi:hypothetical protein
MPKPIPVQLIAPSPSSLDRSLVQDVYRAYLNGRPKQRDTSIETSLREFLATIQARVVPRLSEREIYLAARCKRFCNLSREAAVRKDVIGACQSIGSAQFCADDGSLGPEARLLCQSEIAPVEAYLDLCCEDLENAERRYRRAMQIDQELEEKYGHRLMHGHRIHLQINMVTLEGRAQRLHDAAHRVCHVFRYLAGTGNTLPYPGSWGRNLVGALSPGMVQFFALQLTHETAGFLANATAAEVRECLQIIFDDPSFQENATFWNHTTRGWFDLKRLSTGDVYTYLETAIPFLETGPTNSLSIWQAAALDIAAACHVLWAGEAEEFQQEVANGIDRLSYAPKQIKDRASRMRKGSQHTNSPG